MGTMNLKRLNWLMGRKNDGMAVYGRDDAGFVFLVGVWDR